MPQAARVARKPVHQFSRIRLRRTTCLPSQKSLSVVGSIPNRASPSCEIGRTSDGQVGGGSIMEYRFARISSQVFVMGLPFRLQHKASKEQRLLSLRAWRYCPLSSLINLPVSKFRTLAFPAPGHSPDFTTHHTHSQPIADRRNTQKAF
jgi:hypothetical protein